MVSKDTNKLPNCGGKTLFSHEDVMIYLRNSVEVSKVTHTLLTLKFLCIAIGAYLVSVGRQKKLILVVSGSKRDYIESLFQKIKKYIPKLEQSTV